MKNLYCIKDSNGKFEGNINIYVDEKCWCYASQIYPASGNSIKENAEFKVLKLRELNQLAEYSLDWEVVEFTEQEFIEIAKERYQKDEKLGRSGFLSDYYNINVEIKEVSKGCLGKHRKLVNEIYKKYKYIVRQVGC